MQIKLFDNQVGFKDNILPRQGEVYYFGRILDLKQTEYYYEKLFDEIEWQRDEVIIFGKKILTQRKVAWYADESLSYTYSNVTKHPVKWNSVLLELKELVGSFTKENYNSCLLNLYHSGDEGMSWHSDAEKDLKMNGSIASLSLGAERKFSFKHKETKEKIDIFLENGSLLEMKGETQKHWVHQMPITKKVSTPRINLTFRQINN